MSRVIRHLKDDLYQLVEVDEERGFGDTIHQGTLVEINAYLDLEKKGYNL